MNFEKISMYTVVFYFNFLFITSCLVFFFCEDGLARFSLLWIDGRFRLMIRGRLIRKKFLWFFTRLSFTLREQRQTQTIYLLETQAAPPTQSSTLSFFIGLSLPTPSLKQHIQIANNYPFYLCIPFHYKK